MDGVVYGPKNEALGVGADVRRAVRTGTGGWLDREQERLADQVIRLHVIANSDSPEDQALKLEVRDQVLAHAEELYPAGGRPHGGGGGHPGASA